MGVKTPTNVSPKSGEMPGFLNFFFFNPTISGYYVVSPERP